MLFPGAGSTIRGLEIPWTAHAYSSVGSITAIVYNRFKAFRFGQFIWVSVDLTITTNGTGSGSVWISIPQQAARPACLHGSENKGDLNVTRNAAIAIIPLSSVYMSTARFDNAYWGANTVRAHFSGWYEALM